MVKNLLGEKAKIVITISMFFYLFGGCVGKRATLIVAPSVSSLLRSAAYQNVVMDQIAPVLEHANAPAFVQDRKFLIPIFTLVVIVPLTLLRNLKSLEFTSLLAVVSIAFVEGDVIYKYFSLPDDLHPVSRVRDLPCYILTTCFVSPTMRLPVSTGLQKFFNLFPLLYLPYSVTSSSCLFTLDYGNGQLPAWMLYQLLQC